jgi:hypothetical protein
MFKRSVQPRFTLLEEEDCNLGPFGAPRWVNAGADDVEVAVGSGFRSVKPIDLEWDYLDNALYYQVEWDFGWGTGDFEPV